VRTSLYRSVAPAPGLARETLDARRPVSVETAQEEGSVSILPLEQDPAMYLGSAFDMVQFTFPVRPGRVRRRERRLPMRDPHLALWQGRFQVEESGVVPFARVGET